MGGSSSKRKAVAVALAGGQDHRGSPWCCAITGNHIQSLLLVVTTFFLTSLFHQSLITNESGGSDEFFDCGGGGASILATSATSSRGGGVEKGKYDGGWPEREGIKIYVYEEKEIDGLKELLSGRDGNISANTCVKGQWGTQVKIHRWILRSRYRTRKKEEADLFFVPSYAKCVFVMGGLNDTQINLTYLKVVRQMPYFRRSGGRDHIFVFPSGGGAHLFRSWATYINRSIFLTPEGDRTDKKSVSAFNTWKDIIIPGNIEEGITNNKGVALVKPLPLSKRRYLANYLGRAQGKIGRLKLIQLAKQFPHKLECPDFNLSGADKFGTVDYFQHLRNAKFCFAPRGQSSWTLRFYESFFVECVPVILSDQIELPFQTVIDYTRLSIKWPATRIGPELLEYLESIPDEDIKEMIRYGREVRCLWVYGPETEPCSAMQGIIWELRSKVRKFQQSSETFWLHNRTIVNRNLVDFSSWRPPMPLP